MHKNKLRAAIISLLFFAGGAGAQEDAALLEYVTESCRSELEQYCSAVTPGEGRLLFCIAAHQNSISHQCELALFEAAAVLDELAQGIQDIADHCEDTLMGVCGDTNIGEGRVLQCLQDNDATTSEACDAAVERMLDSD